MFIRLWKLRDRLELRYSLYTYLAAGVRYGVYDRLEKAARMGANFLVDHPEALDIPMHEQADWHILEKELFAEIEAQTDRLPQVCRVVYRLKQTGKSNIDDVWATWCGPCIAEIPSLKKLEHEFEGQDLVFLSISVDSPKDKAVWKDFIVKENLGGVQLFANFDGRNEVLSNVYEVKAIPRFMVVGKDGNVVARQAPRPSQPELKAILETELAK